jgi:hypothetical protein
MTDTHPDASPDAIPAELNAEPYTHKLPDGSTLTVPHESTLPALGKDRAVQAWDDRGERGTAVEIMRLALDDKDFERLEPLTDRQLLDLYRGWMAHSGLITGEPDASTS